jgi:hypothetical protein
MYRLMAIMIIMYSTLLFACHSEPEWSARSVESDKYSFSKFIDGIQQFPYRADMSKWSRVTENFQSLELGMSKGEVIELFGEPDAEDFEFKYPDDKKVVGSSFGYYLTRMERELANDQDKAVFLYFNTNEELFWAQAVNLELNDIGGPYEPRKEKENVGSSTTYQIDFEAVMSYLK